MLLNLLVSAKRNDFMGRFLGTRMFSTKVPRQHSDPAASASSGGLENLQNLAERGALHPTAQGRVEEIEMTDLSAQNVGSQAASGTGSSAGGGGDDENPGSNQVVTNTAKPVTEPPSTPRGQFLQVLYWVFQYILFPLWIVIVLIVWLYGAAKRWIGQRELPRTKTVLKVGFYCIVVWSLVFLIVKIRDNAEKKKAQQAKNATENEWPNELVVATFTGLSTFVWRPPT
jgi:hypothetical protein